MGEFDSVFEALSEHNRQQLLVELLFTPQRIPPLSDTAREMLDADEELLSTHLASSGTIRGVDEYLVEMHCIHLPKLVEQRFVEWHRDERVVGQGPQYDRMKPFLKVLIEERDQEQTREPVIRYIDE